MSNVEGTPITSLFPMWPVSPCPVSGKMDTAVFKLLRNESEAEFTPLTDYNG